jgi:ArsR family transcriptional regulator
MANPEPDELNLRNARVCQALGDPKRLLILYALHEKLRDVSIVAEDLGMPQPAVSRHLSILRQRSLVSS